MKKILAIALALVMALATLSMVACDGDNPISGAFDEAKVALSITEDGKKFNGKTVKEVYIAAIQKLNQETNFTLQADVGYSMVVDGEPKDQGYGISIKRADKNMQVSTTGGMLGSSLEFWYVDGVYYALVGDVKIKQNMTYEEFEEENDFGDDYLDDVMIEIPDKWFENAKFAADDDGGVCVEFVLSGAEDAEYFDDFNLGLENGVSSITYKVYFTAEGSFKKMTIEAAYEGETSGMSGNVTATVAVTEVGTTVVTAPEDAEEWQTIPDVLGDIDDMID